MTQNKSRSPVVSSEPATPSAWVVRFAPVLPAGGEVLDLACGGGRHTRLLLACGHRVVAVDRDITQLGDLAAAAGVTALAADLEGGAAWPLGVGRFAGVIVTNYLHRPILPAIVAAVAPGGLLIYETFAVGHERFGRPRNPAFLLQPGELPAAVAGHLTILAYEHCETTNPRPAVVQRLAARRPDS